MRNTFRKPKKTPKRPIRPAAQNLGDNSDDVWEKTTLAKIEADLESDNKASSIAEEYEKMLYELRRDNIAAYKERFRKDLIALKNKSTSFGKDLLTGKLSVREFCQTKEADLVSKHQKSENKLLLEKELKSKITTNLPDTINQIKSQANTVSEKWGISESAAKIDQDFD
ncbi:hypothetical protein OGAPHI_004343 [Ogataea philodendri]|uniref:TFIIS central domain-containing protein n=1 Tax=Ogataea philodendri TaxID=1378263 RepID=A0A9P8T5B9_9ASCO|nr:uncharacterized protein OGAPHI_004343 [Ogataea philodendri]KAH3666154.1 hypothetical protein OGAPHI_004343 [Ogataea philodendri]